MRTGARTNQPPSSRGGVVSLLAVLILLVSWVPFARGQTGWSTFQGNAKHDGYVPVSFDPTLFRLLWERQLSKEGHRVNPIAAADGMAFASLGMNNEGGIEHFFALDAASGEIRWSIGYGPVFSVGSPAFHDHKVYIQVGKTGSGGVGCQLYEYQASSGLLSNNLEIFCQWARYFAPTIVNDKIFAVGGYYSGVYEIDFTEEPPERWFITYDSFQLWTPAVDEKYVYSYPARHLRGLSIVDRDTGVEQWYIHDWNYDWLTWFVEQAPVLGGQTDVLTTQRGRLLSFDIENHTIRYEIDESFSDQPSVGHGVVYVINDGNLDARDQMTGDLMWTWEAPGDWRLIGSMILTDSHVIAFGVVPNGPKATIAIDLDTHSDVWWFPTGGHLAWSDGILFIADWDGLLTALSLVENLVFSDGFVSGDTSQWSIVVEEGSQ